MIAIATPKNPKKKHSLLPVLTVLFVISYGLMTMLIVEQGSVIQSQGNLIKILNGDSRELWSMKGKALGDKQMAKEHAQNSAQAPSTQQQQQHAPSRTGKAAKPGTQAPPVPAADLVDHRRALLTI